MPAAEAPLSTVAAGAALTRPPQRSRHPLFAYALRRLGAGVLLAVVVSVLVFGATQLLPGDAVTTSLGRQATPQVRQAVRHELGLDKPVLAQYTSWVGGLVQGDLGRSLVARESVGSYISDRASNTVVLAAVTLAIMVPLALVLGVLAAVRQGSWLDTVLSGLTLGAVALPEFATGTLLASLLALGLNLVPPVSLLPPGESPLAHPNLLLLPVLTLLIAGLAYNVRMVRAGVGEVLRSDYVRMARLNGVGERRILWRHVIPNALAPTVQVVALTAQWLIGGVVVVETVFQYPGIGQGLAQAVSLRDIPVVQTVVFFIALVYIVINVAADLIVVLLVPKLRTAR